MNAREMFEKLGYEFKEIFYDDESNYTYEYSCGGKRFIFQNIDEKGIVTDSVNYISSGELQAIIQQCKELGWLEEEKQQETNFEHYKDEIRNTNFDFAVRGGEVIPCDGCPCGKCLFSNDELRCREFKIKWLYKQYEKKYKLTQFEYDLIQTYSDYGDYELSKFNRLIRLKDKGYLKDVNRAATIHDILENCEVIQ